MIRNRPDVLKQLQEVSRRLFDHEHCLLLSEPGQAALQAFPQRRVRRGLELQLCDSSITGVAGQRISGFGKDQFPPLPLPVRDHDEQWPPPPGCLGPEPL